MRRFIAIAVIALHVLLVWLLALGFRTRADRAPDQLQFVSQWIDLPRLIVKPLPDDPRPRPTPSKKRIEESPPAASIAAPVALLVPVEPTPDSTAPAITPAPAVDFARAANQAARHVAEAAAAAAKRGDNFSPPLEGLAKPCIPKERSMQWKGKDDPGLHWYGPIPVLVTEHCTFTIGAFSCGFGKHEANGHLLDDMKDPERSRSSVPDPKICD